MSQAHRVFIGLGSNLEPREFHLQQAARALSEVAEIVRVSGVYATPPVGFTEQPEFLNAVIEIQVADEPEALLETLRSLEQRLGRQVRPKWHEREIDFDILFFDQQIVDNPRLTVPHPHLHERAFVLVPLAEIDANFVHPIFGRTVGELLLDLKSSDPDSVSTIRPTEIRLA